SSPFPYTTLFRSPIMPRRRLSRRRLDVPEHTMPTAVGVGQVAHPQDLHDRRVLVGRLLPPGVLEVGVLHVRPQGEVLRVDEPDGAVGAVVIVDDRPAAEADF